MTTRERIDWVDQARGLGIVLVVIGHVTTLGWLHDCIFLFHMPLFFLLSGYLARPRPMGRFVEGRTVALLVPYFSFLLLVAVLDLLWGRIDGSGSLLAQKGAIGGAARLAFGGSALVGVYGPFWFAPCLFIAGTLFNLLLARPGAGRWVPGAAVAGLAISYLLPVLPSPLGLLQVPMAIVLMACGWAARDLRWIGLPILAGALLLFLLAGHFAAPFDMKYQLFGTFPVNLVAALAGVALVVGVAQRLGRLPLAGWGLTLLGQASLVIMFLHQLVHFHLEGRIAPSAIMFLAILASLAFWWLAGRTALTRFLFLGKPLKGGRRAPPSLPAGGALA